MSDLETLKKVAPTKLLDKFANLHGEELEMSLREIQYAVDPTLTSWSYRSWRFVADGALSTFNLISIPFQWMFTHATASLMSLAGGWLITRFRSGALFGRK
jgi:hypothetical protein